MPFGHLRLDTSPCRFQSLAPVRNSPSSMLRRASQVLTPPSGRETGYAPPNAKIGTLEVEIFLDVVVRPSDRILHAV